MEDAAGGVDSAKSNSNMKKATNMFIPTKEICQYVKTRLIQLEYSLRIIPTTETVMQNH